jgi:hypothetical protein
LPEGPASISPDGLVDHVEVAKPRSHLKSPSASTFFIENCVTSLGVGALLLERDDVDQRLGADHDAGGVDRVGAGEALERAGEVDDLLRDGSSSTAFGELLPGLQRLLERLAGAFRDELRDAVDDAVGDLEHAARRRAARRGRPSSRR